MSQYRRFVGRFACAPSGLMLALAAVACKKEAPPAPTATSAVPQSTPAPTAEEKKTGPALHLLAKSPASIAALSGTETAIVAAGSVIYELTGNGLRQAPEFHQGLHPMHYWESFALLGSYPDAAYWFGVKRAPGGAPDSQDSAEPLRLYRRFKAAWGEADWLKVADSESLIGIVPWKDGRFLGVVRMVQAQDYRFALVGGKPGVALPYPTPGQKPKTANEGANDADASAPAEEAPSDPTLSCPTVLQPEAAAGDGEGHLLVAGYRCSKSDELVVEHFAPGRRKGVLETLPPGGPKGSERAGVLAPSLVAAMASDSLAFVAAVSSSYLVQYDGKGWSQQTAEGAIVDLGQVQNSVWMTTSEGLFLYQDGKWNRLELAPDVSGISVKKAFGLGSELYAIGTDGERNFVLLGLRPQGKPEKLPPGYAPKTYREELIVGSPLCKDLFVVVKSNVKERDNFDSMKAKLTGELASLKLVVDAWKNGKLLGVSVTSYTQAEAVMSAFAESGPRITCHVPNVIRTVE
jgi:hypothetical protein